MRTLYTTPDSHKLDQVVGAKIRCPNPTQMRTSLFPIWACRAI
jgi:hypothetical protein